MSATLEHKALICVKNFSNYDDEEFVEVDLIDIHDFELKVKIYPCIGEFISIYIARETAEKPFSVDEVACLVSVVDCNGLQRFTQSLTFNNQTQEDVFVFGWKQCFNRIGLLECSDELIPDDNLSLQFEFAYKGKMVSKSILNTGKALRKLAEDFRRDRELQIKHAQRFLSLSAVVPDFLKSVGYYFSDFLNFNEEWITIETMHGIQHHIQFKEGSETLGSKLCAASPVFCSILKSPMQEKEHRKIKIIDFDAATFSAFLRFINNEEISWIDEVEDVYSLYEMSDKYEVLELMEECSHYLAKNVNAENVVDIAKLATMHSDGQLKKAAVSFFHAKETWLVGKISTLALSQIIKEVQLKQTVSRNFVTVENTVNSNYQEKQVVLLRTYEDACILYGIADELKMHEMVLKCAQYMKQNISEENARIALSYVKQYHNHSPLSFVKSYLKDNVDRCVDEAFGTASCKGLSPASSMESLYFSCESDDESNSCVA